MLFFTDGIGHSSDGKKTDASSRDYFQKTLEGRRVISSPLSSGVDNETLVVLTVPVYDKDQNIIGVFGGSIDVTELTTMLFEDLYSGSGYSFITDPDGNIISIESTHNEIRKNFLLLPLTGYFRLRKMALLFRKILSKDTQTAARLYQIYHMHAIFPTSR